jgi:hypothetical protein
MVFIPVSIEESVILNWFCATFVMSDVLQFR